MEKDQQYLESILYDSSLPDDATTILKRLITVTFDQAKRFDDFIVKNSEYQLKVNSTLSTLKQSVHDFESKIMSAVDSRIYNITNNQNEVVNKKVNAIEELSRKNRSMIVETERWVTDRLDLFDKKFDDLNADLRTTVFNYQKRPSEIPSTYSKEEDRPQIVDGTVDISPLIRGIYRDSRRLDSFDELISSTRNDCKEIVDSVISMQENLAQFNHNIHDLSLTDGKISKRITDSVNFFLDSFSNNDQHIVELYTLLSRITNAVHSSISVSMDAFEHVEAILGRLSSKILPSIPSLSECQLELFGLKEEAAERRSLYESDRIRFKNSPDAPMPSQAFKDVSVKKLHKKGEKPNFTNTLGLNDDTLRFNKNMYDGMTMMMLLENVSTSIAEMKQKMQIYEDDITELQETQSNNEKRTVDIEYSERTFTKLEEMLSKLNARVSNLEKQPKVSISSATSRSQMSTLSNVSTPREQSMAETQVVGIQLSKKRPYMSAPQTARSARSKSSASRVMADRIPEKF
ncbi:hypothetical protein TVAG_087190 [Trichomonas vaginalis G3]|uniref:Uncharacterized protein n=1 Tax=Trichomonas vaginalis (strain ATCC PRA-98 / G3) TaxID=412133 RepID=A2EN33_TRIV3|nr:hypothetical protein TVAGG3_0334640 [Trichomonas vaginalis G3]EAY05941.1 hypothetical protein TVAG_087190 [Trichomonas vaginalis G3]KAI5530179.1 hypothetical protein TVAGG3_0334640 [Trichomonas vaginalis G3]|eukprot:XP_001318164.1 hypothetical protein [Trichomonas vaginalis G3]